MNVPVALSRMSSSMFNILAAIRQPSSYPILPVMCLDLNRHYVALNNAVKQGSPVTSSQDRESGLSRLCEHLIRAVTSSGTHTLRSERCDNILLVPCMYISEHLVRSISDLSKLEHCDSMTRAMKWVMQDPAGGSPVVRTVLAGWGAAMMYMFCTSADLMRNVDRLQPDFVLERCFYMMCIQPTVELPRDHAIAFLQMAAAVHLCDAYARAGAELGHGMMSPCLLHYCRRSLGASMDPLFLTGTTQNLLGVLLLHPETNRNRTTEIVYDG